MVSALLMVLGLMGDRLYGSLGLGTGIAAVNVTVLAVAALLNLTVLIVVAHQSNKISDRMKTRHNQET